MAAPLAESAVPVACELSIILPCLNEAAIVRPALVRLQALRGAAVELILVDGGSRDGTPRLAAPLVDQLLVSAAGRARQMNAGARLARGRVLWFLHVDTAWPESAVALLLAATARTGWGRFDVRLSGERRLFRLIERMMNWRSCLTGIATGDQGIFVVRDWFFAVGGYPQIALMEDIALSKRLKRRGMPACIRQPLITASRRWESQGVLLTVLRMWSLRLAYFFGVDPATLARWYPPCNTPGQDC